MTAVTDLLTRPKAKADLRAPERPWPSSEHAAAGVEARSERQLAAALFAVALGYATLRYNVVKGVPWADWPAYTVNKALAVASLLMIAATVIRLRQRGKPTATLMSTAGALALAHSLLSFALLNPGYYARLFDGGKLTAAAGLSLTLGAGAMAVMELGARRSQNWSAILRHRGLAIVALISGIHAALPAVSTWFEPATWPGGMPPLTLISFTAGVVAIAALAWRTR